ncbi:MAG: CD225/dispanin family protein, partial [Duncaniella dubosii]|nr:CD225/dispanin family protein [Duncaniella dubosii]
MPDNYLIWAILATICCCIPSGIVAIFYAAKVSPAYYRGDYMAALDASSKAQLWVIISFVAGLIWAPFSVIFGALF